MKNFFLGIGAKIIITVTWIFNQVEWIKSFFGEPDGKASFKRLGSAAVIVTFLKTYFKVSWDTKTLVDIPQGWAVVICLLIGITAVDKLITFFIGMKTGQFIKTDTKSDVVTQ
jgi:hypothetical protein